MEQTDSVVWVSTEPRAADMDVLTAAKSDHYQTEGVHSQLCGHGQSPETERSSPPVQLQGIASTGRDQTDTDMPLEHGQQDSMNAAEDDAEHGIASSSSSSTSSSSNSSSSSSSSSSSNSDDEVKGPSLQAGHKSSSHRETALHKRQDRGPGIRESGERAPRRTPGHRESHRDAFARDRDGRNAKDRDESRSKRERQLDRDRRPDRLRDSGKGRSTTDRDSDRRHPRGPEASRAREAGSRHRQDSAEKLNFSKEGPRVEDRSRDARRSDSARRDLLSRRDSDRDRASGSPFRQHCQDDGRHGLRGSSGGDQRGQRDSTRRSEMKLRPRSPPARLDGSTGRDNRRDLQHTIRDSSPGDFAERRQSRGSPASGVDLRRRESLRVGSHIDDDGRRRSRGGSPHRLAHGSCRQGPRGVDERHYTPAQSHRQSGPEGARESPCRPPTDLPPLPRLTPLPPPPPRPPQQAMLPSPPPPRLQPQPAAVDPALDFFSLQFDALKALNTPGLQPPNPRVRPLDNLARCTLILPEELPESTVQTFLERLQKKSQEDTTAADTARHRIGAVKKRAQDAATKGSALARIAERTREGPLTLLKRCYQQEARVRVVTRHARGVRGTATGTLRAFDRYMNLVLHDVEEHYTVRLKVLRTKTVTRPVTVLTPSLANGAPPVEAGELGEMMATETVEKTRMVHKQEKRQRHLKQIFVRGSNIVLISAQPAAAVVSPGQPSSTTKGAPPLVSQPGSTTKTPSAGPFRNLAMASKHGPGC